MKKKILKYGFGLVLVIGLIILAQFTIGAGVNLKQSKTLPLTEEQKAILAVRNAKASVVNIIGTSDQSDPREYIINGTGFIVDSGGYIVSNNHVVSDDKLHYKVMFADGSEYAASIVGMDKYDDVALLKIEASGLPVAVLGNSDTLETGESVFAIGNSLGRYQNTVTRGVVSGLGRALSLIDNSSDKTPRMQNLIQTDAAINFGNSGGPLINLNGEVVGMNTLIDSGGSSLGFAVPVNVVKSVVSQLRQYGKVSKPYMGISFSTITRVFQTMNNLTESQGAYIITVDPFGPAAASGIKQGDIIVSINGEKLTSIRELDAVISSYESGNQITVTYVRGGKSFDVPVVLGQYK